VGADGEVVQIVIGTRGVTPKTTVDALKKLNITKKQTLITLSLIALRNSDAQQEWGKKDEGYIESPNALHLSDTSR
jgi:hypothetical protein